MHRALPLLMIATCLLASAVVANPLAIPAASGAMAPHLAVSDTGTLVLSWIEPADEGHALRFSTWHGGQWQPPVSVARGDDWFVNWADFPSVEPIAGELWAAHWLRRSADSPYAYDVVMALSINSGKSWSDPQVPHDDGTHTEHGFVSLFPSGSGVGAIWLDGRNTSGHGHDGAMTLRYAELNPTGGVSAGQLLDGQVCDCCQTDVALTAAGPIAVFRDRSAAEIRDIGSSRMVDGKWLEPQLVSADNWEIAGCPVNGPAVAAQGHSVVVAWYTQADDQPQVRAAWSQDAGAHFSKPVVIDSAGPLGRVDVALDTDGRAWVSWMREAEGGLARLMLRPLTADGALGNSVAVAENTAARPAGFPQLAISGHQAMLVWTDARDGPTHLVSQTIELAPTE